MIFDWVGLVLGCFLDLDRGNEGCDGSRSAPIGVEEKVRMRVLDEEGSRDAMVNVARGSRWDASKCKRTVDALKSRTDQF